MPFIRGGDLMKMIEKKKNIDEKVARFYAAEIILALEYLHKNGVVYRDLKPANLLLDEQGHLKLADMGLSIRNKKTSEKKEFYGTLTYIGNMKITFISPRNCVVNMLRYIRGLVGFGYCHI